MLKCTLPLLLVAGMLLLPAEALLSSLSRPDAATWRRTKCGVNDQVTQYGLQVDPLAVLPDYPRPQLVRGDEATWANLNGLWEWTPTSAAPVGALNGSVLVPFPVESCLSGVGVTHTNMTYQLSFQLLDATAATVAAGGRLLLHFGAVDWQTDVFVNGAQVGERHQGGYDPFSFDVTDAVAGAATVTVRVVVFDPSDLGVQPEGKQRISAIDHPGTDTYTPSSGIWQTVWLELTPATYVATVKLQPTLTNITVNTTVVGASGSEGVTFVVLDGDTPVANATGVAGQPVTITVPEPKLWWPYPGEPFLYNLLIRLDSGDEVTSYFGLRTSTLGTAMSAAVNASGPNVGVDLPGFDLPNMPMKVSNDSSDCWTMCNKTSECAAWAFAPAGCSPAPAANGLCWLKARVPHATPNPCRTSGTQAVAPLPFGRPHINNKFVFRAGWLDQSFWPDGIYTAPTDDALKSDLTAVHTFGLNTVRLHQKVNPERWYWYADTMGIIVLQDAVQKYTHATNASRVPFLHDLERMMTGPVFNHPSVVQWETFNEHDCVGVFNASDVVQLARSLDPHRLIDTDSGGPANSLYIGDVNDIHTYPTPGNPTPSTTQYSMVGEFGGIGGGWEVEHSWVPNLCHTYLKVNTTQDIVDTYVKFADDINQHPLLSCTIYTQITDVELECDGFINYDRSAKFTPEQVQEIYDANQAIINAHSDTL